MGDVPVNQNDNAVVDPQQEIAPGSGVSAALPGPPGILSGLPNLNQVAGAFLNHWLSGTPKPTPPPTTATPPPAPAQAAPADDSGDGSLGSKLVGAAQGVMGELGDAAHATDRPGGWLSGVVNTLNARSQRLAQEKKDNALLARTQAETVAMHRNAYLQSKAINDQEIAANQKFVDAFKVNHEIETGVTGDELKKRMQNKDFIQNHFVRKTGDIPMLDANGEPMKDKNGDPITHPEYSIITRATKSGEPDDKEVSPEMSGDMQKYLGQAIPAGTKLTGLQFAALSGQVALSRISTNILNETNGKEMSPDQMRSLYPYLTDPTIQAAISHVPGNAYAGLQQYLTNADDHIVDLNSKMDAAKKAGNADAVATFQNQISEIQQEKSKVQQFTAMAISPKQIETYNKTADENITLAQKVLKDPSALTGDKASGVLAQLEENLKNATDQKQQIEIGRAINAAKSARENYFSDTKRKAEADQLAKQGDPNAAGRALANRELTLADLRTRQTTADFILQATEAAKKFDPTYNAADEVAFEKVAAQPRNEQLFGSSRSLVEKGGTVDMMNELGKTLPDTGWPVLNKVADWEELARGKGPLAGYAALALGIADDYGKVMGGGTASDTARDSALHLFAAAQTQEQREKALEYVVKGVMSQRKGLIGQNKFTARQYDNFEKSPFAQNWQSQQAATPPSAKAAVETKVKNSGGDIVTFKDDPAKRPAGTTSIQQGSDGNWYYFGIKGNYLGPAPKQE